jgi:hypothetical protein
MLASLRSRIVPASLLAAAAGATYAFNSSSPQVRSGATSRPVLRGAHATASQVAGFAASADGPAGALNPSEWKAFKLTEKEKLTHNTYRFRHASIRARSAHSRPYQPSSPPSQVLVS